MGDDFHAKPPRRTLLRTLVAVLIGVTGSFIIFVATPYNNFVLAGQYIADSYLPPAVLFLMLALVLVVNPILRAVRIFPNESSCLRLITALAIETSEEWQDRRDLDLSSPAAEDAGGLPAEAAG